MLMLKLLHDLVRGRPEAYPAAETASPGRSRSERMVALNCRLVDGWYNFDVDRRFGLRRR